MQSFLSNLQKLFHEYMLEISLIGTVASGLLLLFGILMFLPDYAPSLVGISNQIGDWKYWLFIISPLLLMMCGFYLGDNILKRRKFDKLVNTTSKANFVRNQDDIEYLAWKLTERHATIVEQKKKEFGIKDKVK